MSPAAGAVVVRLGTRGSALARAQAEIAAAALRLAGATRLDTVVVRTHGDRHPQTAVEELSGQGWFTAELERALLDGEIDVAVHSFKDLAIERPPGLVVAAVLPRGDPCDALVTRDGTVLAGLPAGARVGSSSRRRAAFLAAVRGDVEPAPIRGNVDTRLRKLDSGEVDALLLAAAGLDRLHRGGRVAERLDPAVFVPAPAQGAIAVEVRRGSAADALVRGIGDTEAEIAVTAERTVLAALGGGCLLPLGAWARVDSGRLTLHAALARDDGSIARARVDADPGDPEAAGRHAAELLR
ncbi:MAG TPA: hydroxymethylbilane synthase [Candidatus Dormibacteraeota bacterium]